VRPLVAGAARQRTTQMRLLSYSGDAPRRSTFAKLATRVHRVSELNPKPPRDVVLTANQAAIVQRMVRGENTPEIARAKQRSVDTVRKTVRTIYSRFGVSNAAELKAGMARGAFAIRFTDDIGREHNLRSALGAIREAVTSMRAENCRMGTKRRRSQVSLHEDEMNALLAFHAQLQDHVNGSAE
jgi:DNA-binding CsgD family transcriptional regulator